MHNSKDTLFVSITNHPGTELALTIRDLLEQAAHPKRRLYFHGEEVTLSVRLWTHGWDLYAPNDVLIYHDYTHDRGRPKHWRDNRDWTTLNARSFARVRYLLEGKPCADPLALREIERYGLGGSRQLPEFEQLCGVDFATRTVLPAPG